jgi:hypothetical protein
MRPSLETKLEKAQQPNGIALRVSAPEKVFPISA